MESTGGTKTTSIYSPRLPPKAVSSVTKSSQPVTPPAGRTSQAKHDTGSATTNVAEKGNIKGELESKFGMALRKGSPGSPGQSSRRSGHVPTTALQPKSNTKPTVMLSQAGGPIASHFSAKAQDCEKTQLGDITGGNTGQLFTFTNTTEEQPDSTVSSQAVSSSSTKLRPPYVNLDFDDEEPQTVLHKARAVYGFRQAEEGEISIISGQKVEVLKDDVSGWSFIRIKDGSQGWCPAKYIAKCDDNTAGSDDDDHDYQNEDFPVRRPPTVEGIKGASANVDEVETGKSKFEISDITKVKLRPTAVKTLDNSSNGAAKPVLPVKPTKALKPPVTSKKPTATSAKPQLPTNEKPSISAKPKLNITSPGGGSVQKLAKTFNQK